MAVATAPASPNLSPRAFQLVLALVIVAAMIVTALWTSARIHAERHAVAALPAAERAALYRQETDAFRRLCTGETPGALAHHCSERAGFLTDFPECDAACRELVRVRQPFPTR